METITLYEIEDDAELSEYVDHILANCITVAPGQSSFEALNEREISVSHKFIKVENFKKHVQEEIARAERFQYRISITHFEISGFYELEMFRKQATITIVLSDDDQDIVEIDTVHDFAANPNWQFNELVEECFELVKRYNLKRELLTHVSALPCSDSAGEQAEEGTSSFKI